MKKSIKILLIIAIVILSLFIILTSTYLIVTKDAKLDYSKLINLDRNVTVYSADGDKIATKNGSKNIVKSSEIPDQLKNAFIATEDKRFYNHGGVDFKGLMRSTFNNILSFSFKEGGSTITQQLIKNTHLSNEKTIKRKLSEIKLAIALEKKLSKDEILEKYLNTIYFGNNCYGIADACEFFYGKEAKNLTLSECAGLAGLVKAPSTYSPIKNYDKFIGRRDTVLQLMNSQGFITDEQLNNAKKEKIELKNVSSNLNFDYLSLAYDQLSEILKNNPYYSGNLIIDTYLDVKLQENLVKTFNWDERDVNKSAIIIGKNGQIKAYLSTCGDIKRQVGSTIKPILVYSPCIEENLVYPCSPILDEKTSWDGYSPKNYNDTYQGYISVKQALESSSNVCSVKLLDTIGVDKALKYAKKVGLEFQDDDKNLSLALGSSKYGQKFSNLVNAYNVFQNDGDFYSKSCIKTVKTNENRVIYQDKNKIEKVFDHQSTALMNYMLDGVVQNGTARRLKYNNAQVYGKTGTVGNSNGNTDAYCISYNSEYIVGTWYGSKGSYMDNTITGGNAPATYSNVIWKEIYPSSQPGRKIEYEDKLEKRKISLLDYNDKHKVVLAEEITPNRYVKTEFFKNNNIPSGFNTSFSHPKYEKIEILENNSGFSLKLCQTEFIKSEFTTYKNGNFIEKKYIDDCNYTIEIDKNKLDKNSEYSFFIIPYYSYDNKIYYGEKIILPKIKTPRINLGDDWMYDDL